MKKIISAIFFICAALFSVCCAYGAEFPEVTVCSAGGNPGDIIEVPVVIKENNGVACLMMDISYGSNLELIDIKLDMLSDGGLANIENGKIVCAFSEDVLEDGTMFTAVFKIKGDAPAGEQPVSVEFSEFYSVENGDFAPVVKNGKITVRENAEKTDRTENPEDIAVKEEPFEETVKPEEPHESKEPKQTEEEPEKSGDNDRDENSNDITEKPKNEQSEDAKHPEVSVDETVTVEVLGGEKRNFGPAVAIAAAAVFAIASIGRIAWKKGKGAKK